MTYEELKNQKDFNVNLHYSVEQFDGSLEMMKKYQITDDGFGETYTFRLDNNALPLKRGWWIVYLGTSEFYGLTLVYWRTMSDEKFNQTYERVEEQ